MPTFYFGLHVFHFLSIISSPQSAPIIARCAPTNAGCMHCRWRCEHVNLGDHGCTFLFTSGVHSTVQIEQQIAMRHKISFNHGIVCNDEMCHCNERSSSYWCVQLQCNKGTLVVTLNGEHDLITWPAISRRQCV